MKTKSIRIQILPLLLSMLALPGHAAESFVKNDQERARIAAALPAKAPASPAQARRLLIFTLNVNYGGHPSMAHANEAFTLMGQKTGAFETVVSNDPAVFERESLKTFDAVFFNNTVGNCFTNAELRRNLVEFVLDGGGLMGVHGTSVAFTQWPGALEDWPEFGYLIGARGANHKDSDEHLWMKLDDPGSPILKVFGGQPFDFRDEFFRPQGTYSRQRVRVLLSIDTTRSDPDKGQARGECYRADGDYAVAWIRNYGKGRVFYCTIAHNPYVFWDARMLSFYLAAAQFVLGDLPCATTPSAKLTPAVRAQEKLGWRLVLDSRGQGSTFGEVTERGAQLGLAYVAASGQQSLNPQLARPFGPGLTDAELEQARLKLESAGVRLLAYCVTRLPDDDSSRRSLFDFGRKMGIETFLLEQRPARLGPWEIEADASNIKLALRAKTRADAVALARICHESGPHIGVALDLSDPSWSRANPFPALSAVRSRLFLVRLPEAKNATAGLEPWLTQIWAHGATPIFLAPLPGAQASIDAFNSATLQLPAH